MTLDEQVQGRIAAVFKPLEKTRSAAFPSRGELAEYLSKSYSIDTTKYVTPQIAATFATAAIDMWHRSVHSFLTAAALTSASPVWSSVSGYYSSHYTMRGFAHVLGYFYVFSRKGVAKLEIGSRGGYSCTLSKKPNGFSGGEHQLYWSLVKSETVFATDPIFTENNPQIDVSDSAHRNYANYIDHLCSYPVFHPLDTESIKARIDQISKIVLTDTPIPRKSEYPDVDYVQLVAYHRLVSFRQVLDEVLGTGNRFWSVHRDPSFAKEYLDYQIAEPTGLSQLAQM